MVDRRAYYIAKRDRAMSTGTCINCGRPREPRRRKTQRCDACARYAKAVSERNTKRTTTVRSSGGFWFASCATPCREGRQDQFEAASMAVPATAPAAAPSGPKSEPAVARTPVIAEFQSPTRAGAAGSMVRSS